MGILYLLSYVAALVAFVFITLSLASGLLWLAEMIEEHSRLAKVIGQRAIWVIIGMHAVLYFDSLPLSYLGFSVLCHVVYLRNITNRWPLISLTSPTFILSCVLVFVDHLLWFNYFSTESNAVRQRSRSYGYRGAGSYGRNRGLHGIDKERGFGEIATFFAICVWAVPLFLFLSLSANDNALPIQAMDATPGAQTPAFNSKNRPQRSSLLRRILKPAFSLLPSSKRRNQNGLIAPPSPNASTALFSPQSLVSPLGTPSLFPYPQPSSPSPGMSGNDAAFQTQTSYVSASESTDISGGWATIPSGRIGPLPGLAIGTPPPRSRRVTPRIGMGEKDD